ncbi:MATE family efflux transporter [Desulfobotulus sp.]|jgi:putative MATE family efflux protein|uniref:MATE family efflux transporter n=1 Tax=Desulfobotulus sp. TaxID=1940337 RepID=UPI002A35C7D0|nr:GNAT family N-acetyltransferase [Desulfobotulus sp.]MDY0163839.1 GNAT family N-acetyltransferase [Desulfobotulus sp.]
MKIQLSDRFTYGKLINFTLPSIAMMIFTSIYSVVDGFFVSNYAGKIAFSAVTLIMPFLMIVATVGFMFGTGGTAIVANTFGAGDKEKANRYFSLFVYVAFVLGVLFAILGFVFIRPIATLLGAKGELLEHCIVYGRIVLTTLPFFVLQLMFQSFFVAAEKPRLGLFVTGAAGVTNMVLDAVLVISLPLEYKLAGAAIATSVSQFIGGVIPLIYFSMKNSSILHLGKTIFDGKAIFKACTNGSSEFMNNVSMSIVGILYNIQLLKFAGENGVAAYGVMMFVSMIFSATFIGYSIGVAPVFSYHDGSRNHDELKGLLKKSLRLLGVSGIVMVTAAQLLAVPLAQIFVGYDKKLMDLTVSGFRIFAIAFPFMGFAIFGSGFFTSMNDGLTSAIISFLRTLVFQLGAVLLLPMIWGIDGIWISIVVAEVMAVVFTLVFLIAKRKKYHYSAKGASYMNFKLLPVSQEDLRDYKKDMQEAFQKGAAAEFSDLDEEILPEEDIDRSLNIKGAIAYKAIIDGEMVGGAMVVIDEEAQCNHLNFLYVKYGTQSRGVGQTIWKELEKLHPDTKVWETVTPYFEKRNIHFYVNRCGFHIVEFFNPQHKDYHTPENMLGGDYFFRFEKQMV